MFVSWFARRSEGNELGPSPLVKMNKSFTMYNHLNKMITCFCYLRMIPLHLQRVPVIFHGGFHVELLCFYSRPEWTDAGCRYSLFHFFVSLRPLHVL